ncbi:replication protein [Rhodococcus sp. NPDC127528]|uniref:replication protein n=1 Tax=unclassified Rhodococcus (in: high G+C Gram-positive bacteria) TaxID=192944 RepID=UPI00362BA2B7
MTEHTHAQGGIQRGPRRADRFTILSNAVLNDARLSFRARGVLMWLLSKPADWRTRSEAIADQSPTEGRDAIRTAMRELEGLGYLVREKVQDDRGRWHTLQTIYEEPVTAAAPGPEKTTHGQSDGGQSGAFTKDGAHRTETNDNPAPLRGRGTRQCAEARFMLSLSEKSRESLAAADQSLANLEAATLAAGLPASYARTKATQRGEILAMIDLHGIPALVDAAKRAHREENPTMHVHGWIRLWKALPLPRPVRPAAPLCGSCVEGWLDDDEDGRAVRCSCRTTGAGASS